MKIPDIKESDIEGACDVDLVSLHQQNLHLIDFKIIEYELNSVLAGAWQYSSSSRHRYALYNPVFTREGDLIDQLTELKKGLLAAGSSSNGTAQVSSANGSYSSLVVQGAKLDLSKLIVDPGASQSDQWIVDSTRGSNGSAAPISESQGGSAVSKTPLVAPPDISPAGTGSKAAPGFNAGLKTGSPPKSTPTVPAQAAEK